MATTIGYCPTFCKLVDEITKNVDTRLMTNVDRGHVLSNVL